MTLATELSEFSWNITSDKTNNTHNLPSEIQAFIATHKERYPFRIMASKDLDILPISLPTNCGFISLGYFIIVELIVSITVPIEAM